MRWTIVAFRHPADHRSVLYRQALTTIGLLQAVEKAVSVGANLMSIRGFEEAVD